MDGDNRLMISRVKLGAGGAASVWLGKLGDRVCAIKRKFHHVSPCRRTSPGQSPDTQAAAPIPVEERSEAAILTVVGPHPHIISLLSSHQDQNYQYCALELMVSDLSKEIKEHRFPKDLSTIRYVAHRVVQAIAHVHHMGFAHRDVKPSNVLLQQIALEAGGVATIPFVSDFGSAHGATPAERPGLQFRGTKGYMPPETLMGKLQVEKARAADMWSIGCLTAELFLGGPLFSTTEPSVISALNRLFELLGSSFQEFPNQCLERSRLKQYLRPKCDFIPDEALDFIEKLLMIDPDHRLTADEALAHPFFHVTEDGQPPVITGWQLSMTAVGNALKYAQSSDHFEYIDCDVSINNSHNSSGSVHLSIHRTNRQIQSHLFDSTASKYGGASTNDKQATQVAHRLTLSNLRTTALFVEGASIARPLTFVSPQKSTNDDISPTAHPKRLSFDPSPQTSPQPELAYHKGAVDLANITAVPLSLDDAMMAE